MYGVSDVMYYCEMHRDCHGRFVVNLDLRLVNFVTLNLDEMTCERKKGKGKEKETLQD
jgi:hypothetical protein